MLSMLRLSSPLSLPSPNLFLCHTYATLASNSFPCHTSKFIGLKVLSLPHFREMGGAPCLNSKMGPHPLRLS
jgi:hypothetical protein